MPDPEARTVEIPLDLLEGMVALCFREMPRYFRGPADGVVEWRLRGPAGGRWQVVMDGERCEVQRGGRREPDVRLEVDDLDFVAVCLGRANPRKLALQRRLKPRGSLRLAARLQGLFDFPAG